MRPRTAPLDDQAAADEDIGVVDAARGTLMHRIELSQGCIRNYRIIAPTEWNFHPRGVSAQTRALICAIDSCVAYDLDIRRHA